ncbi:MAG: hypothetical protein KDC38_12500, partial [Planctomycetes bacterium]|nr:hypothetical protein [Planctomycetota bacterium]
MKSRLPWFALLLVGATFTGTVSSERQVSRHALADGAASRPSAPEPAPKTPVEAAARRLHAMHGMVVSCPGAGAEWGRDAMVEAMRELRRLGVDAVGTHPYAGIREDGSVPQWFDLSQPPAWITRPIREGRELGMRVMVKPHLGYWGSRFSWRGEIEFDSDEKWARFFEQYRQWIVRVAELSRGADLFVVGTELDRTLQHEKEWRHIIAEVRQVFDGPVTYSANWTDYQRVPFWDALDVIGIHAYFPLVDPDQEPTREAIEAGWTRVSG